MALSIKDQEADRLARELAKATGESITVAVRRALQERLAREAERSRGRIAILLKEPDSDRLVAAIEKADVLRVLCPRLKPPKGTSLRLDVARSRVSAVCR